MDVFYAGIHEECPGRYQADPIVILKVNEIEEWFKNRKINK